MGVDFQTNVVIGKTLTIDELLSEEGYDAILVATGAGLPKFLEVPGEHLNGVYSANEFLTRVNLMRAYDRSYDEPVFDCRGKDIAVVGGGNTAMDAVRTACRLGARTSYLIYGRSEKEMPARAEEVKHAREEGIQLVCLTNPVAFLGEKGSLAAVRCLKMELGEPDASGRRSPCLCPAPSSSCPCRWPSSPWAPAPTPWSNQRPPTCRPTARATSRPTRRPCGPPNPAFSPPGTLSPGPPP
jgi:glutamate synthase (NADPH/NADH) small chain